MLYAEVLVVGRGHPRLTLECGRAAQQIFRRFYVEGLPYAEVATQEEVHVETVRKTLYRVRQQLRECAENLLRAEGGA